MASLRVKTSDGSETKVEEAAIGALTDSLRGGVLRSGDESYESARKIFNAMIDKHPAMILQCAGTSDVIKGVTFAREHDLLVAVRGGGHSVAGKSLCDGGLLIDLSAMRGIHVDPKRRTARAQPGLRLGDFDRETQVYGLATTTGIASDTGIAGLTLGGGIGWLCGKYGLACDNLISAEVVTADGRVVTASAEENADLFWGLRGGSGNFGIVTSFEYQLHAVGPVVGGVILYSVDEAKEVLRFYDEFSHASPDELSTIGAMLNGPDGNPVAGIAVCYCGSLEEGEKLLKPLRSFGSPVADLVQPMSYVELQSMLDWALPVGRQHYWKSNFLQQLNASAIDTFVEYVSRKPSPFTFTYLQQMHGAASRVAADDTAFPHRYEQYDLGIISQWEDPADAEKNISWTKEFWEAMQPNVEHSVYVNNLGEEGDDRVRAAYGANYERLAALKRKYDPTNFFSLNHNIKTTV